MKKEKYITPRYSTKEGHRDEIVSYTVSIPSPNKNGRKTCQTFSIEKYNGRRDALAAARQFRDKILEENKSKRSDKLNRLMGSYTVKELYRFIPKHFPRRKQTYLTMDKVYNKYIDPQFGNTLIEDIRPEDIVGTLCACAEQCAQRQVNRVKTIWHRIYQEASIQEIPVRDWTLLMDTPVSDIVSERSLSEQNISEADFQKFCEGMAEYGHYMPQEREKIYNRQILLFLIKLLRISGMRPQEAKALRRCDISFDTVLWLPPESGNDPQEIDVVNIRVAHSIGSTLSKLNVVRDTKTPQSRRTLTLGQEGVTLMKEVLNYSHHDLLFSDFNGEPFKTNYVSGYFRSVSKSVGIKVYPLLMRKAYSADLYANAVNPAVIRSLMGHKEENMSLNAYATASQDQILNASLTRKFKQ